jgi:hypothetical protein
MATDNKQPKLTKRQKTMAGKVDSTKLYPIDNALKLVKEFATAKFDESIDVAVQLGIDPKKSDQVVRGAVVLPNGTGKTKRVAVFAQGAKAEAKAAGADISAWKTWPPRSRRQDGLRRRHRAARHDSVVGTLARSWARWPDAEPEGRPVTQTWRRPSTPRPARCSSGSTRQASSTRPSAAARSTTPSWSPTCAP